MKKLHFDYRRSQDLFSVGSRDDKETIWVELPMCIDLNNGTIDVQVRLNHLEIDSTFTLEVHRRGVLVYSGHSNNDGILSMLLPELHWIFAFKGDHFATTLTIED